MRRNTYILIAALLCLMATPMFAQQTNMAGPMTLQKCLEFAMCNQVDVITARNNVVIAKGQASEALSAYLPQLSIQNNSLTWGSGTVLSETKNGTALDISQSLFDGGIREANNSAARHGVTKNRASLTRTVQTVTFNVTKSYYDVLRAKHLLEVAEANVKYSQKLREQVAERVKTGDAAEVDLLPVEAELANAQVSVITAQNDVRTSSLELQTSIGLSPCKGFDVVDVGEFTTADTSELDRYMSKAVADRPDILKNKANTGAARAELKAARINLYPRPVITGQYQRKIQGGYSNDGGQVVGGIVFNLFDGGASRAAYREARASVANAAVLEQQTVKDIEADVEEAYLYLGSSKDRVAASEMSFAAAKKNHDVQMARYSEGVAVLLDTLNSQAQLITAQSNLVDARYDYLTAIAQMEYAVGTQGGSNAK